MVLEDIHIYFKNNNTLLGNYIICVWSEVGNLDYNCWLPLVIFASVHCVHVKRWNFVFILT